MSKSLMLKVLTPEKAVFEGAVEAVQVELLPEHAPALSKANLETVLLPRGEKIQILAGHQPLAAPLALSVMKATQNGSPQFLTLMGGQIYTDGDTVTVLSDAAELGSDIDVSRAQQARERAEALLRERSEMVDVLRAEKALYRALNRLQAASLVKH